MHGYSARAIAQSSSDAMHSDRNSRTWASQRSTLRTCMAGLSPQSRILRKRGWMFIRKLRTILSGKSAGLTPFSVAMAAIQPAPKVDFSPPCVMGTRRPLVSLASTKRFLLHRSCFEQDDTVFFSMTKSTFNGKPTMHLAFTALIVNDDAAGKSRPGKFLIKRHWESLRELAMNYYQSPIYCTVHTCQCKLVAK